MPSRADPAPEAQEKQSAAPRPTTPQVSDGEEMEEEVDEPQDLEDENSDTSRGQSSVRPLPKIPVQPRDENSTAGPSGMQSGWPTNEDNLEIETVGHRIQRELVTLAKKKGQSYTTLLKKIGFLHQEVCEPTMSNVFKQVMKHRLLS